MTFKFCRGIYPYPGRLNKRIFPEVRMYGWVKGNARTSVVRNKDIPMGLNPDGYCPFHMPRIIDINVIINHNHPFDPRGRPEDNIYNLARIPSVILPIHGDDHFELGAPHLCCIDFFNSRDT